MRWSKRFSKATAQNGTNESASEPVTLDTPNRLESNDFYAGGQVSDSSARNQYYKSFPGWDHHSLLISHIKQQAEERGWFDETAANLPNIALRKGPANDSFAGTWLTDKPEGDADVVDSMTMIAAYLGCGALLVMSTRFTRDLLDNLSYAAVTVEIPLLGVVPIVDTIEDITQSRTSVNCIAIRESNSLLLYTSSALELLPLAEKTEKCIARVLHTSQKKLIDSMVAEIDIDSEALRKAPRRSRMLVIPVSVFLSVLLLGYFAGDFFQEILYQVALDGTWLRLSLVLYLFLSLFLGMFFANTIVSMLVQLIGPIGQLSKNSLYYSGIAPKRIVTDLPSITVQCPVYTEDLNQVLRPTILSIKKAMASYDKQGGQANLFINDDGMQVISAQERIVRQKFYRDMDIGWVARPKHGQDGFVREGKFKKASNMNYALHCSTELEQMLISEERDASWTVAQENDLYARCVKTLREKIPGMQCDGDIRVGDLILIVDSDTRVPEDCFLDAASEFVQSPELGILQQNCGILQVVHNFWENGIAYFWNLIYFAIRSVVAGGEVAPFIGHNAYIRWSALQELEFSDLATGLRSWWSTKHVSEDFEVSLRLQIAGYSVRLAAYHGDDYKEGVSLTVYDEKSRWEKYAFGVSELMFNPLKDWWRRGPFTKLFRSYLGSRISPYSKFTTLAYMGTYYAIGAQWILFFVNFFMVGWFEDTVDSAYVDSFKILISVTMVFWVFSPFAVAWSRFRAGEGGFWHLWISSMLYTCLLVFFFSGLSIHVSKALLCHLFSVPLEWSSTVKVHEASSFFDEAPRIWRSFKYSFAIAISMLLSIGALSLEVVPVQWRITNMHAVLPLAWVAVGHLLMPVVLNPMSYLSELQSWTK